MKNIIIVGLGGFLGSIGRYLVSKIEFGSNLAAIPFGTLLANIAGSLLIGLFAGFAEKGNLLSNEMKLFLMTGFCGGFTTFSSFSNENLTLMRAGDFHLMLLYTGLSIFLGFAAVFAGYTFTKLL